MASAEGWQFQFWIPDGPEGRGRKYVTKSGFRTKKQAQDALTQRMADFGQGKETIEPSKIALKQYLLEEWLPQARRKPTHDRRLQGHHRWTHHPGSW